MHATRGLSHLSVFYLQMCHGGLVFVQYCCDSKKHGGWAGHRAKMVAHLTGPGKGGKYFNDQRAGAGCLEEEDICLLLENLTTAKEAVPVWFENDKYDAILTFVSDRHSSKKDHRLKLAEHGTASFFGGSAQKRADATSTVQAPRKQARIGETMLDGNGELNKSIMLYEELAVGDIHVFPMETPTFDKIQS